ncbi:MAG: DNA polymerase III subunit beta [Desulfobacteraceae bacterium]|nr:MAG: DNA polymerase III subunit beta [Desulfobacteraceae bacterium]
MEIKINKEDLLKSVARVQSIIEKRSNMPILQTVLISSQNDSKISVSATDLEISFQQTLPAQILQPGSLTISGRKLFEILKESNNSAIHLKAKENNWVHITDGKAKFNLACLPAEEYPLIVEPEDIVTCEIESSVIKEMIGKTIFSVTLEEAGFKLSGVFTEKVVKGDDTFLRMVSTDGHRLSLIEKKFKGIEKLVMEGGVMIPKKGLAELMKLAAMDENPIKIGFRKNHCVAKKENIIILIRLVDSKFPDYNAVIPKKEHTKINLKINKNLFLNGMKKMVILSDDSYRGVKISLEKNNMELVSIHPELGDVQENIEIEYNQERFESGFNARYFIDLFQVMDSEEICFDLIDASNPCLITGEDDAGFMAMIMPMRI